MTANAKKRSSSPYRRKLYGKIAVAMKDLRIDDDVLRVILFNRFNVRSRTELSDAQLVELIEHFKDKGFKPKKRKTPPAKASTKRPLASQPVATKIRALWLSLHHLGLVKDASESALKEFVRRQTGVMVLQWLTPGDAYKVIEALKKWAERDAGVNWQGNPAAPLDEAMLGRVRVLEAQWRILKSLGEVGIGSEAALSSWINARYFMGLGTRSVSQLPPEDADDAIRRLGDWIRSAQAKKDGAS